MALRKVFLIDGTAFSYRAFYAIRALATADGRPTNAVYGFVTALQALRQKERPDALAVAFDAGKPTFRHEQFTAYKEHRKPMPEELIGQLPVIKQALAAYRIPVFEQAGFEAEDLLATLAKQIVGQGVEVYLVTGDKDAMQLVNSHIKVYNPQKDNLVMDAAAVKAQYGIAPEAIPDLLALMGDATDNIPGVNGIGPKTAVELLQKFGSVDRLYARLDEIDSAARRQRLLDSKAQVAMARELATIRADAPITASLDDMMVQAPDTAALRRLFRELEFKKLLRSLDVDATPDDGAPAGSSPEELHAILVGTGPAAVTAFAAGDGRAVIALARGGQAWSALLDAGTLRAGPGASLRTWLADAAAPKLAHDAKLLMHRLATVGTALAGLAGDTMVAAHLVNPARTEQSLSDLSAEVLEQPLGPQPATEPGTPRSPGPPFARAGAGARGGDGSAAAGGRPRPMDGLIAADPAALAYAARSARAIAALHARLLTVLEERKQVALYQELELPLISVLAHMEATGVGLDVPYLGSLQTQMAAKLSRLTEQISAQAGGEFNLNSPKQLGEVLFARLKLPVIKRGKTGPSTDSSVLQQLAEQHPLPKLILEYRELSKLVSTYVEALPLMISPVDGRLHTCLNQTSTATGRLSSSEPNLQNIPIKTELGRSIRKAFIPGTKGWSLVAADYSQVELRIFAHLSGDARLSDAFRNGKDIHRFTASLIYGVPEGEVTPEQRSAMKAVNFGILYGMSAFGLSKELRIPQAEAHAFITEYFARYPQVRAYLDRVLADAKRLGYVQTLLGRRRYIPELASPDPMVRQFGERIATNAPVQGTAADLIKRAMVQVAARLAEEQLVSRMTLQVHDELVFEAPAKELDRLVPLVRRTMEGAWRLDVPLAVTVKSGPNWLELRPVPGTE